MWRVLIRAFAANVAGLTALIARLACSVKWTTVGSSTVTRDVSKLAARIAFHRLSLAISCKMVGAATLVASGRTPAAIATTTITITTTHRTATSHAGWVGTSASKVTGLAAGVAALTCSGSVQTKCGAVGLYVAKTLAMIALLCFRCSGKGALIRLVARLLAVVA